MSANSKPGGVSPVPESASEQAWDSWLTMMARGLNLVLPVARGRLDLQPDPASLKQAITVTQSGTGTNTTNTPLFYNQITVSSDDAALSGASFPGVGGPFKYALEVTHYCGGANMIGGVNALSTDLIFTAATSASNTNRNYSALFSHVWVESDDGGTGTTSATAKGAFFGAGIIATAIGATNILNLAGLEINVDAQAGSSGYLKEGLTIAPMASDAVSFPHNIALSLSSRGGVGTDTLISINRFHGALPLKAGTGVIMRAEDDTITTPAGLGNIKDGIDLSLLNIQGNFLNSVGFTVAGQGQTTVTGDSSVTTGGDPTYQGDVRLVGLGGQSGHTENQKGGIEFKPANASNGYGYRLLCPDLGSSDVPLIVQRRNNSATWTDQAKFDSLNALIKFLDPIVLPSSTVAGLPAASATNKGARAFVTDATVTTFASVVAGGGGNFVPVYSDQTNWRIG